MFPPERLVDALWGEQPPATAANALQVAVHGLRKVLGHDRLRSHGGGYELVVEQGELDFDEFERADDRAASRPRDPRPDCAANPASRRLSGPEGARLLLVGGTPGRAYAPTANTELGGPEVLDSPTASSAMLPGGPPPMLST